MVGGDTHLRASYAGSGLDGLLPARRQWSKKKTAAGSLEGLLPADWQRPGGPAAGPTGGGLAGLLPALLAAA